MDATTLLLQGAALGLTAAASPGSFQTYLISQALAGGWRRGAPVALAPLLSDPPIIVVILLLLDRAPTDFLRTISLVGGLFVFYLAWGLWREWRAGTSSIDLAPSSSGNSLRKGVMMNLLSPGAYTFWTLVCGPILLSAFQQSIFDGIAFLAGFYTVFIGALLILVAIFHQARRLGQTVIRVLMLISILILVGFGAFLVWQGVKLFLP